MMWYLDPGTGSAPFTTLLLHCFCGLPCGLMSSGGCLEENLSAVESSVVVVHVCDGEGVFVPVWSFHQTGS